MSAQRNSRYHILWIWLGLILFWVLAVYSVSIHESFTTTLGAIRRWTIDGDPSNYFYFIRHIRNLIVWLVMGMIVYKIPLSWYKKYYVIIFVVAVLFQLLVFTPLWDSFGKWARNWISVPGLGTVQPSEFFKLGFVIFLSAWLIRKRQLLTELRWYVAFLIMVGACLFVYFLIPDLGTIMILGLLSLLMYWYGGGKKRFVISSVVLGLLVAVIAATQFTYIRDRLSFFVGWSEENLTNREVWRQQEQALMAIGGGWVFGKWYGKWLQKFWYIPEAQSDFIFAAFSEEIGFLGNSILLTLYFLLVYSMVHGMRRIHDPYYRIFGVGLISLLTIQAFVNMWVNTSILPNTGLTLPFISVWWTALMSNIVSLVLMHKIVNES